MPKAIESEEARLPVGVIHDGIRRLGLSLHVRFAPKATEIHRHDGRASARDMPLVSETREAP